MITFESIKNEYNELLHKRQKLILEKKDLPKGSLQSKHINGCDYIYWQYYEDGHTKSVYIESSKADEMAARIKRYKDITAELREVEYTRKLLERALGKSSVQNCIIDFIREVTLPLTEAYPIKRLALFGSRATGKFKFTSDVDLLVELSDRVSLLTTSALRLKLEDAIGLNVDLVRLPLPDDSVLEIGQVVEIYAA